MLFFQPRDPFLDTEESPVNVSYYRDQHQLPGDTTPTRGTLRLPSPVRTSSLALALVSVALAASGSLLAQSVPTPVGALMPIADVRPGMRGYGLTVFRGTRPERFDVEVIDVLRNFRPRMDLVLVRPSHPTLDHAGVVGGMSGSPIFLEGRLAGAYSYGWEFGRDPVAGVTPIHAMLAELRRPRRTPPGLLPGSSIPLPIESPRGDVSARSAHAPFREPVPTAYGTLVPASSPLSVGGMATRALAHLAEALEPFGIVPVQTGGGGSATPPPDAPTRYEPGGAVAVRLIQGDISGNVTGTVTHLEGNNVLAFGHPMTSAGETALPAGIARVLWILASSRRSFKISEPLRSLGSLVSDRGPGIVIDTLAVSPTLPVRVRVRGVDGAPRSEWNATVASQRPLAARLAGSVIETAIEETASDSGDVGWTVRSTVHLRGRPPLVLVEHGSSAEGPRTIGNLAAPDLITRALDNAFGPVIPERLEVEVELRWAREFSYLRSASVSLAEVEPGAPFEVRMMLHRYGLAPEQRAVTLIAPREMAGREMEIEVAGGNEATLDLPEPESTDDILRNLSARLPDDAVVVSMRMPGQGVTLRGRTLANLPGSAFDALRPAMSSDSGDPMLNWRRAVVSVGRVVLGRDRLRVRVREVRQ